MSCSFQANLCLPGHEGFPLTSVNAAMEKGMEGTTRAG